MGGKLAYKSGSIAVPTAPGLGVRLDRAKLGQYNVGAIVAPLVVPWVATRFGWPSAFLITGATGFVWLVAWLAIYRKPEDHPRVSRAELEFIRSDPIERTAPIPWADLLRHRQTWAFAAGKFFTDPI